MLEHRRVELKKRQLNSLLSKIVGVHEALSSCSVFKQTVFYFYSTLLLGLASQRANSMPNLIALDFHIDSLIYNLLERVGELQGCTTSLPIIV